MSTASPLPLQPLPLSTVSQEEQHLLREEVSARLQAHRRRRPQDQAQSRSQETRSQAALPGRDAAHRAPHRQSRVADSVAARFAQSVSYRDFLAHEAEAAIRQAEAAAEVARRSAEAIADSQQRLLDDIEQWNRAEQQPASAAASAESRLATASVLAVPAPAPALNLARRASVALAPETGTKFGLTSSVMVEDLPVEVAGAWPQHTAPASRDTTAPPQHAAVPVAMQVSAMVAPAAEPVQPELPPEPTVALPTNLIEFPRQLVAARKARPRLAEGPLREDADNAPERAQLRIFEVEADAFSTVPAAAHESVLPEWSNIRLDSWLEPHDTTQPQAEVTVTLPLYTAPVSQRVMALCVDACCIGTAFLLAVAAAAYAAPELPEGKFAVIATGGALLLFAVMYLLLSFTFSDSTPGMRYARIGLCTFNDENPTRAAMRRRLFAMVLAAVPAGLGFAWALLDDDRLGWHDRISRMYQRAY